MMDSGVIMHLCILLALALAMTAGTHMQDITYITLLT